MLTLQAGHAPSGEAGHAVTSAPAGGHGGEQAGGHGEGHASQWSFFLYSGIAFTIICIAAIAGTRRLRLVPRGAQAYLEFLVETLYSLPEMVMGPRGRKYGPFVGTVFLLIFVNNLLGLVPFGKAGTASLSVTAGLALVAFVGVQVFGFMAQGIKYPAHFLGPIPVKGIVTLLGGLLLLPLELVSELIRPVSLSFRLFGNIFGEEQVVAALATRLGPGGPFIASLMLPLQVMTSVLQALVFALLVSVYIALATEHGEEHEEAGGHEPQRGNA